MKFWNLNKKDDAKRAKKKKILLGTLIPLLLIVLGLGAFLSWYFIWRPKNGNGSSAVITQNTIVRDSEARVIANTPIYHNSSDTKSFGHDLLDLSKFSETHNKITTFIISGEINFGFLVGFNMDCHIYGGMDRALVKLDITTGKGVGVIVGSTTPPSGITMHSGNLSVESDVSFNITSEDDDVYGCYFGETATNSVQTINGTFDVTSKKERSTGVWFEGTSKGTTIVNGTFTLAAIATSHTTDTLGFGVVFYNGTSNYSYQTINGFFTIMTEKCRAVGVTLCGDVAGSCTINGIFTISAKSQCAGVTCGMLDVGGSYRGIVFSGKLTVNGMFALNSADASTYGVFFPSISSTIQSSAILRINGIFSILSTASGSLSCALDVIPVWNGSITIDGVFTITGPDNYVADFHEEASVLSQVNIKGHFFLYNPGGSTNTGTSSVILAINTSINGFDMGGAEFFSNAWDHTTIFTNNPTWQGQSYSWNNNDIDKDHTPAASNADSYINISFLIYDTPTSTNSHIWILKIDRGSGSTNYNFNDSYKTALTYYHDGDDCPTIAKSWVMAIINKFATA